MSSGIIDLRPGSNKKPPSKIPTGLQPLFSPPPPRFSEPKRPVPLRARRRRARLIIALVVLILLAGVIWGVHYVSYLPKFSIQTIDVMGAEATSPQLIQQYVETILNDGSSHFLSRDNIFLYPRARIVSGIVSEFPRIAAATVSRPSLFSTTLTVQISERQQYALWCTSDGETDCYAMDQSGFVFAQASGATSSAQYLFTGGLGTSTPIGQTFAPSHVPGLVAFLTELSQDGFSPKGADVQSAQDFNVPLAQGYFLKASFGEDPDQLVKNLQLVLSSDALQNNQSNLEYVDLRFGDKVYYKLAGQTEATSTSQ